MAKLKRPKETKGSTPRMATGCGNLYLTLGYDDNGKLIEVFSHLGKAGGCAKCQLEAITRTISLGLKYGIPVEEIVDELKGLRCPAPVFAEGQKVLSCADAIAKMLSHEVLRRELKEVDDLSSQTGVEKDNILNGSREQKNDSGN